VHARSHAISRFSGSQLRCAFVGCPPILAIDRPPGPIPNICGDPLHDMRRDHLEKALAVDSRDQRPRDIRLNYYQKWRNPRYEPCELCGDDRQLGIATIVGWRIRSQTELLTT
jgi:hypothetical protein